MDVLLGVGVGIALIVSVLAGKAWGNRATRPVEARSPASPTVETPTAPPGPTIEELADSISHRYLVSPAVTKAIISIESSWNPDAKNPSDPSYGLMGIKPILAQDFGYVADYRNPTDREIAKIWYPEHNITIGVRHLRRLLDKYPLLQAVEIYNVGEHGYNFHGYRNSNYVAKFNKFYSKYGG